MKNRLVIIPAFNEAGCIVNTVEDIRKNAPSFDYVVINDCSLDETQQLCEEHRYNLINLPINSGIGAAVQTGYLSRQALRVRLRDPGGRRWAARREVSGEDGGLHGGGISSTC